MTDNEINVAIAEACGWKFHCGDSEDKLNHVKRCSWSHPQGWKLGPLPDYCHDLNAMHEAEKVLNEKQQVWYMQKLTQVRYKDGVGGMIGCMMDKIVFATARQRAEAFCAVFGKRKEDSK